jgi:8-oxo-dGTP pyrophosphatase MutT (NUDIX family)
MDKKKDIKYHICKNCGTMGHEYNTCKEPITSWGIILVKVIRDNDINFNDISFDGFTLESDVLNEGIKVANFEQVKSVALYMKKIQFLLVRRKHSLGYMEFVRGKYVKDNIDGITYLFQQMTPTEILKIKTMNFEDIWMDLWGGDQKKISLNKKEFIESKNKFECLKNKLDVELGLNFYTNCVKPYYDTPEWGFPKGRKSKGESDLECAIREFCEETGYNEDDINILSNVKPIVENIIGTNGVSYRHIYFLAEDISTNIPTINEHNKNEIGDIGYFIFDDAYQLLRDYHVEKRGIIRNVFMYFINEITNFNKTEKNKNNVTPKVNNNTIQTELPSVSSWCVDDNDFF